MQRKRWARIADTIRPAAQAAERTLFGCPMPFFLSAGYIRSKDFAVRELAAVSATGGKQRFRVDAAQSYVQALKLPIRRCLQL
jgi:hypothetical protein